MDDDGTIVTTPDGREFVVEMWRPPLGQAGGPLDGLILALWSLVRPGWRINVKIFPVKGMKTVHTEKIRSKVQAQRRVQEIAESLQQSGTL